MKTNRDFYKDIRGSNTAFYLSDLHVHTPASLDVSQAGRLADLSLECRTAVESLASASLSAMEYERKVVVAYPPSKFLEDVLEVRDRIAAGNGTSEGLDWAFIGLTDHNVCAYSCEVARLAWEVRATKRLHVLPGIELDVRYSLSGNGEAVAHVLCLFRPGISESDVRMAVHDASLNDWQLGTELAVDSLPKFVHALRNHKRYPAICIAAHVATQKGVREETKMLILSRLDAEIARVQQELEHGADPDKDALNRRLGELQGQRTASDEISLSCLKLIGDCGFDALQISSHQDEVHYRYLHRYKPDYGRAVPIIASDAHSASGVFVCSNGTPYLKLRSASSKENESDVFDDVRNALRLGETRFSFSPPGAVQYWIAGFEVTPDSSDAASFWPYTDKDSADGSFFLPMSRNLNAFVGGRGAGKSAAIEALSFICQPRDYETVDHRMPPDWYTRAKATLAGCNVRLCFQFLGGDKASEIPKRALFARRHFSQSEDYEPVHLSDIDGHELLSSQIPPKSVTMFRLGEIEKHAGAERLRSLFDGICGPEIADIENQIKQKKEALRSQRSQILSIAEELAALTAGDKPLRDYLHRQELLAAVDRPEVREAYERIDQLEKAQKTATAAKNDWGGVEASFDLDSHVREAKGFFDKYRSAALTETGETIADHEEIIRIVGIDTQAAEEEDGRLRGITDAADKLNTRLKSVMGDLKAYHTTVETATRFARDAMQQQGLPSGAKDREAKKRALEEAQEALRQYRELLARWQEAERTRRESVNELQGLADRRSQLREQTAMLITERLKRDLDSDILVIEANARTQCDTNEFRDWLETHFAHQTFKYREKRISALLELGLTPADLRGLLSDPDVADVSLLVVPGNASQGGVERGTAQALYEKCVAVRRLSSEKQEAEVDADAWKACPEEIRKGLLDFPSEPNGMLCADAVLELDEILFDDEPVILLNDRPQDADAKLRPLEELSPGQRCSAILPILLLTGEGPLIIDQPEDNLDNRLIRQVIVNILASIKLRRQVIVATHNPNVPVLGDVENVVVLRGVRDRECVVDVSGDLDEGEVVHQLTQVMEGGREAFQYRQTIYQLHWSESVARK